MFHLDLKKMTLTMAWDVQKQPICYHKYSMKTEFLCKCSVSLQKTVG